MSKESTTQHRHLIKATKLRKLIGVSLILITVGVTERAMADTATHLAAQSALQPSSAPLNLGMMQQGKCSSAASGVTDTSISQAALTTPSFWWARDQIAAQNQFGGKLMDNWLACSQEGNTPSRADFIVNQQVWSLLDYLERYEFVHELGTAASGYGYNMRVFNRQGTLLAAYTCDFSGVKVASGATKSQATPDLKEKGDADAKLGSAASLTCALSLDTSGKAGFRGRPSSFDGAFPIRNGTVQP